MEEEGEEEPRRGWFDLEEKDDRLLRSGIFSGLKNRGEKSVVGLSGGRTGRKESDVEEHRSAGRNSVQFIKKEEEKKKKEEKTSVFY